MDQSLWLESLRAVVVLRAVWDGVTPEVQAALGNDATIVRAQYRQEAWFPSYVAATRGDTLEIYIQGTSNNWQISKHVFGGAVGQRIGIAGVVHSGFYFAGTYLSTELSDLIAEAPQVVLYGHSYGGAVAQTAASKIVEGGKDSSAVRVVSVGAPKVYNDWVGDPSCKVELIANTVDPVPLLPGSNFPVITLGTLPPGPVIQRDSSWDYRGDEIWLSWDGSIESDYWIALSHPKQPVEGLGADAHLFSSYVAHLAAVHNRNDWPPSWEGQRLLGLFAVADGKPLKVKVVPDSTWVEGMEYIHPEWNQFSSVFHSKGFPMANDGVWCKVHFRCGPSGWSESYLYRPASGPTPTFAQAEVAIRGLIKERARVGAPVVRINRHYYVDAVTFKQDGGNRKGWVDWNPVLSTPNSKEPDSSAGYIEFPFMGYLTRLWSGDDCSRTLLLRPIADTAFMNALGEQTTNATLAQQAIDFGKFLAASGNWQIKGRDYVTPAVKDVTGVTTAALVEGQAYLTVPGHGYAQNAKVAITGGEARHKQLRGVHRVLSVPSSDQIHIDFGEPVFAGVGGPKVQEVTYRYYPITAAIGIRVTKRDTSRPIKQGHGY